MIWLALVGWVGWALTLAYCVSNGWRPFAKAPEGPRKAQLFNAAGRLDSVRTFTGHPPASFICRAGTYTLDKTAQGPHFTYRLRT